MERKVFYYHLLPESDRKELIGHVLIFLGEKHFEGCGGLSITDEIKVTIAAQACLLLLHRPTDYYPRLESILVYPHAYLAPSVRPERGGVIREGIEPREGESWREGAVVLAWDEVKRSAARLYQGQNVVLHEFAHQLDQENGAADGTPVLPNGASYAAWARVLGREYQELKGDLERGRPTFIDGYGATDPAEFFAVVTEHFFEEPHQLRQEHPELYRQLELFYRQDPASYFEKS